MNRLKTFLSISALSLASSVSVAVAENKELEHKKVDNLTTTIVDSQQNQTKPTDAIFCKETSDK
ncbi:hypothetical protein [Methylophaga sp.]|uniref:hypothetical protein n=1 Tax=Methylophaga sp. TaxID=2024840 RepID=UPI002715E93C|nr:hypothetical protein [Methylophaga sp.]MDO8825015.1 hypothetical protein [Methylophaga sp.]